MMLDKMPTDENLTSRGCHMPSMCSLCHENEENTFHLFFLCPYVIQIWNWFAHSLNCTLQFQSKEDIWSVCKKASNQ